MIGDRAGNRLVKELKEIEQQIAELKALQFNGSSNNYSGKIITSNEFLYTPSSDWSIAKGFVVITSGTDISLASVIMDIKRNDNNAQLPLRKAFRLTSFNNGVYENRWNFWDYASEYPQLKVKAHSIINGNGNIRIEGLYRAY